MGRLQQQRACFSLFHTHTPRFVSPQDYMAQREKEEEAAKKAAEEAAKKAAEEAAREAAVAGKKKK